MNHQEWFERLKSRLEADEPRVYGHLWVEDRWTIIQVALIKMAIQMLPNLQRRIVELMFFNDLTDDKVARELKLSRTRVHYLKQKALKTLMRSNFVLLAMSPGILERKYSG
ncbi:hypothetical protein A3H38_04590 [candidate division WOR-1 bacterium RIFCSPLOWO2_02_FULL_46_20]|uniref:RNA polymerase sigma-70 region 4 domain-containing protein n=2 Tax=Saganbacteria TaxID=1703751 RepID=A0A1F4R4F3_UNCSA|nr:MAG: hypothetical protein A3J44_03525 [candidate division WOR-1 bacterium RIFCSPHIGHO2_02_FULL_45_12]OGC03000.1 MAG: hypothetical protein A3H38_04590 [candidate division WOR-1 bacterium RIFCSPLOWO2_02_FULL_46_20]OGC10046.1 MAG: hypothetical protein A3F86_02330 [candidate division WOR-1 bacterium RIFCSPLOWO2_12_FULL_45_9]